MASKAYKKIMKEKQDALFLQNSAKEAQKPAETQIISHQAPRQNLFAAMRMDTESEEEETEEKEQKKTIEQAEVEKDEYSEAQATANDKKKKKKKKKKAIKKGKDTEEQEDKDEEMDEPGELEKMEDIEANNALLLNPKNFNYVKEMDRLFKGAKLIEDADISSLSKREKGHLRMLQNKFKKQKQNYLIQSTEFPGALPDHLDCEFIKVNELGQRVFAFKPTQKFQNLYDMYEVIKNTHDPNELIDFCHVNPFYPQALYDLSEFFRLKGNYKEANRLLERMLYLYEESFSYDFDIFNNDTDKIVVLDYDYNSFTQLFLKGIFKFIAIITKKGCYQSALEYCKLLLKLSPAKDPMGALMYIDHVSISAKKFDFFEDFASNFASQYLSSPVEKNKYSICLYPNIIYSLSLIKFYRLLDECHTEKIEPNERLTKVEATLAEDITLLKFDVKASHNFWICLSFLLYPKLLISILQETELNKQSCSHSSFKGWQKKTWAEILEQAVFLRDERDYAYSFLQIGSDQDTEGIEKVIRIYAERNKVLWRNKFVNLWLKSIVGHFFNLVDEGKIKIDPIIETLLLPPDETGHSPLKGYLLPFEPKIHKRLIVKEFSDVQENLNLNNIQDNDPLAQGVPVQGLNPINTNQNWLNLLMGSLMPWNDLPGQNGQNFQAQDEEDFEED